MNGSQGVGAAHEAQRSKRSEVSGTACCTPPLTPLRCVGGSAPLDGAAKLPRRTAPSSRLVQRRLLRHRAIGREERGSPQGLRRGIQQTRAEIDQMTVPGLVRDKPRGEEAKAELREA